jgi:hypothetical protein
MGKERVVSFEREEELEGVFYHQRYGFLLTRQKHMFYCALVSI